MNKDIGQRIEFDELDITEWTHYEANCGYGCSEKWIRQAMGSYNEYLFAWCRCQGMTEQITRCQHCGYSRDQHVTHKGPHLAIVCMKCNKTIKYTKQVTVGMKIARPSKKRTNDTVTSKDRLRIIMRDNNTCQICNATNVPLHVDHKQSIKHAEQRGEHHSLINRDDNLWTLCQSCNLGKSANCIPPCPACDPKWRNLFT